MGVQRKGLHEDVRRSKRRRKRPCETLPAQVTGLTGEWETVEASRESRVRMRLRWDEATVDQAGRPINVRDYKLVIEYSANGSDWFLASRHLVPAADDEDPNNKVHWARKGFNRKLQYRAKVAPRSRRGCVGPWTEWLYLGSPGPEEPPAPSNVRVYESATDRAVIDWDVPTDPGDNDLLHIDVAYFQAQISKSQTFATIYRFDRHVDGSRRSFKVADADKGDTFYLRVRSVDAEGRKSAWIPGTLAGNSDPNATPSGVTIGAGGGGKEKVVFHVRGRLRLITEEESNELDIDEPMKVTKVRARVRQAPTGSSIVIKVWKNNTTLVTTVTIPDGQKRGVSDGLSVPVADGDSLSVEITQVGSTFPGKHLAVKVVMEP